jgi:serine/threonine-protein kinase RsbW
MRENPVLREVTLTLPMAPDMEVAASKTATALAEFMRMSPEKVDEVRLAVVEACINAFEHSHSRDRRVRITFAVIGAPEPEKLEITVQDAGVGFNRRHVEEPNIVEKIRSTNKRGWGLKIIEGLMDEVEIDSGHNGTTVVMRKRR